MKPTLYFGLAVGAFFLAGCSSTPDKVDTGVIQANTFTFVKPRTQGTPAYADNRAAVHAMIQDAVTQNLEARGLRRVEEGADLTVAYLVIIGNNATTTSINQYFGYGRDAAKLHSKAHAAYGASQNPNYFEAGTLVVDLVDSKTFELLWRNHITRPLLGDLPAEERPERIQNDVDELLNPVRLAPR